MIWLADVDHRLSLALHAVTRRNEALHTGAVVFARWVFWILLAVLLGVVYLNHEPLFVTELAKVLMLSIVFGFVLNLWLGKIFVRKRPFVTHRLHALIPTTWLGTSFPSDHAMLSFAIAVPLYGVDPRVGAWALVVAGAIGLSRVLVGVHYLSDVLVGSAVGIGAAMLAMFFVIY